MKLFYLNDLQNPVRLYKNNLMQENFVKTLDKAEGCVVELEIPEGAIPFIKVWQEVVLISYWENYET